MTAQDRERYSRQILFPPIGESGQERLLRARVAIVGCGALGTFQAGALARAGVGSLRIIDRDFVEPSNLQRQWLFTEADAAEALPKAVAAKRAIAAINSGTRVEAEVADLTASNAADLLEDVDLILDGSDNFEVRYLVNDYCVSEGLPWIYGGAVGSYGLTMPVVPGGPCLRCLYPDPPGGLQPTCDTAGVLGPLTATVAALQTAAAMKILCGEAPRLCLTMVDVWQGPIREVALPERVADCPACGLRDFVHLRGSKRAPISLCGRDAVQIHERNRPVDLGALRETLSRLGEVRANEFGLRFFCPPYQMTVFPDGRAIIKGTTDIGVARSLYARYIGG
ncbi:MAG: ThiF family adenylyltransferase [Bryobacterales bacterium]|nr:ThiF family adenylyltransferase [Bryobacterales bacterium]